MFGFFFGLFLVLSKKVWFDTKFKMSADVSWYTPIKVIQYILKDFILWQAWAGALRAGEITQSVLINTCYHKIRNHIHPIVHSGKEMVDAFYKKQHLSFNMKCVHFPVLYVSFIKAQYLFNLTYKWSRLTDLTVLKLPF